MKVVIAGGGFCGSMVAKRLDGREDFETTLIDEKPYFEYCPSLPKLLEDPGYHDKMVKPYSEFLHDVDVIHDEIKRITPEYVYTSSKKIEFDILVVSLGADYPVHLEDESNVFTVSSGEEVKNLSKKIKEENEVLIVGGGLIGTEAAAELASKTQKKITLVHSHDRLIERNSKTASYLAEKYLKNKGVELILGERVEERSGKIFRTTEGKEIEADVCIWSTGLGYNRELFQDFGEESFASNGALKVNEHLQVEGYTNIFAGGDITAIKEEKTGHNADTHSRVISDNLLRTKNEEPLRNYPPLRIPLVISLGDVNGLITLPYLALPGPLPALLKYLLERGALLRL